MKNKALRLAVSLAVSIPLLLHPVEAQQAGKVYRVGWVTTGRVPFLANFREGMRELGYAEGQNLVILERYADGKAERLPGLLAELLSLNVDILVTSGSVTTRAAREASTSAPVVFITGDPVGEGFISSLARPGGRMTGLALVNPEVSAKWIELLKDALPQVSRVAVLRDPNATRSQAPAVIDAARSLKIELLVVEASDAAGIDRAVQRVVAERVRAIVPLSSALFSSQTQQIVSLVARHRLLAIYEQRNFVDAGGLMSYGPNYAEVYRRTAVFVDKILKGAKPADLPVEQPTKFELVINLKTATTTGVMIPQSLLLRADEVIQ